MTSPTISRFWRTLPAALALLASLPLTPLRAQAAPYYPGPHPNWERRQPAQVGMSAPLLEAAIAFARESETPGTRDLEQAHYLTFSREPHGEAIGPFAVRGDPTGVIVRRGYVVAQWGDPDRVDMTFSVTKSFLSTVVGLAFDRG
jgi:CubicO group peptidase (beta-lactamase class C family)